MHNVGKGWILLLVTALATKLMGVVPPTLGGMLLGMLTGALLSILNLYLFGRD